MLIYKQRYKPRTSRAFTKSDLTVYDSAGNTALNALTVYGKSEVVDGSIKSAGEGWATVDLGTLNWTLSGSGEEEKFYAEMPTKIVNNTNKVFCSKYPFYGNTFTGMPNLSIAGNRVYPYIYIRDNSYTDVTAFKNSLNGVLLCYELADPTQGNAIAVKTDNGSGIDGTMAVFETGTPLRGIPDTDVRDVMQWDGSAGTVTKVCAVENLGTRNWNVAGEADHTFYIGLPGVNQQSDVVITNLTDYTQVYSIDELAATDKSFLRRTNTTITLFRNTAYSEAADFKTSMTGKKIIYELATPTTEQLTTAENASLAGLRTFEPTTHAQNNAQTDMTVDYTIRVPTI